MRAATTTSAAALGVWAAALAGDCPDALPCPAGIVELLEQHGLAALAAQKLNGGAAWPFIDAGVAARLRACAGSLVARELAWAQPLAGVLAALDAARIPLLVIKGEALARTLYPKPGMRERCDVDLWVRAGDFLHASEVLVASGFAAQTSATGYWSLPERAFVAGALALDLHQQLFSRPLLARALDFDAVFARATALPGLAARAPASADALLIAVLHRVGHHGAEAERLIWLYDIDLLVRSGALEEAAVRALEHGVAGLLAEALDTTRAAFGTPLPNLLFEQLRARGAGERASRLLRPMGAWRRRWFDFASLPGVRERIGYLRELALPDVRYMRERYGVGFLPWLYLRRALGGIAKSNRG